MAGVVSCPCEVSAMTGGGSRRLTLDTAGGRVRRELRMPGTDRWNSRYVTSPFKVCSCHYVLP